MKDAWKGISCERCIERYILLKMPGKVYLVMEAWKGISCKGCSEKAYLVKDFQKDISYDGCLKRHIL